MALVGVLPELVERAIRAAAEVGADMERQRATVAWKCVDHDAGGLSTRLPTSDLSIGRLLKHLTNMEDLNFTRDLGVQDSPEPCVATLRRLVVDMIEEYGRHRPGRPAAGGC